MSAQRSFPGFPPTTDRRGETRRSTPAAARPAGVDDARGPVIPRGIDDADEQLDAAAERAVFARYDAGGRSPADRARIVAAYVPCLRRIVAGVVRGRRWKASVDELLGPAGLAAIRAVDAFLARPRSGRFGAYLQVCVRREIGAAYGADRRPLREREPAGETDPRLLIEHADSFRRRLETLSPAERALVRRRFVDGLSLAEAASAVGLSEEAARRLQTQAFAALRMRAAVEAAA